MRAKTPTPYRIVPKRDFGARGFLINGKWVRSGFIVLKGACNTMPAATWFLTVADAMDGLALWIEVEFDAEKFWAAVRARQNPT